MKETIKKLYNRRVLGRLLVLGGALMSAQTAVQAAEPEACKALEKISFERAADNPAVIIKARHVTDGKEALKFQFMFGKRSIVQGMPVGENVKKVPSHCRIEGYVAPAVKFLILLPQHDAWNSKVMYASCDAFCGAVDEDMPVAGLLNGYATIATDGGHINKRPFDGVWGNNNREGEIDFGYRASHVAAQMVKAVAKAYYGREHTHAYTTGFSKGGHAGIKSALKYPGDYDGIVARAPVVRYQEINAVALPWIAKANSRADGSSILGAADAAFIHKAAIKSCDAVDGVVDGIIDDPRDCSFEPATLLCKGDAETGKCLTAEQVGTLKKFYSKPRNDKGKIAYPYSLEVGSEKDWPGFHVPRGPGGVPYARSIASSYIRYLAFDKDPGATYDWRTFDPVKEKRRLKKLKYIFDADGKDLRKFRDAGGKMIILHGWADGAVTAQMTIDWYEKMKRYMGPSTSSFVRLFVMPGNKHGGSPGDGPNVNESMAALEKWVEEGVAPEKLILRAEKKDGTVTRTRPVYPYPVRAKYKGSGSIDKAENFGPE